MTADLRAKRTQKAIKEAFVDLLHERDYDKINVQDIVTRAMINRSTFYQYYFNKSDLTGKLIAEIRCGYEQFLFLRFGKNPQESIKARESLTHQDRRLALALLKIQTPKHNFRCEMHTLVKNRFLAYASNQDPNLDWDFHADSYAAMALHAGEYYLKKGQELNEIETLKDWQKVMDILQIGLMGDDE